MRVIGLTGYRVEELIWLVYGYSRSHCEKSSIDLTAIDECEYSQVWSTLILFEITVKNDLSCLSTLVSKLWRVGGFTS